MPGLGLRSDKRMANSIKTKFVLTGVSDLRGFLGELKLQTQDRVIAETVKAAAAPIVADAKKRVVERTGALKKSLTAVVKKQKRTGATVAYIGAQVGYFSANKTTKGGYKTKRWKAGDSADMYVAPYKYSHLVEYGHRSVHGGGALPNYGEKVKGVWNAINEGKSIRKGTVGATSFVPPRPFLSPAFEAGKTQAEAKIIEGFEKAVAREYERAKRKFNRKKIIS